MLSEDVTTEEVYQTIKSIGPFKAPGPDGFQAIFYPNQWSLIESSLVKTVKEIFLEPWKVSDLNDTFITLIPKLKEVMCIKQFRPIGLCNVSYKSVTKLLARRIRTFLHKLVGPAQCAFVPRHHSQDNIIVAQEFFHSMRYKKVQ